MEKELFPRKCSVTNQGMFEGWVVNDGDMYFKYEKDALQWCIDNGYKSLDEAYNNDDIIYWTEWNELDIDTYDEPIYEFN